MGFYKLPFFNGRRFWKKFQYQAFGPQSFGTITPYVPPDPDPGEPPVAEDDEVFMSSLTITPYIVSGSDTSDVEIADVFIETTGNYQLYALMGSGHTTATCSLKVKDSAGTTTLATLTAAGQVQQRGPTSSFAVSSAATYIRIYATCSATTSSWMVRAITIVAV